MHPTTKKVEQNSFSSNARKCIFPTDFVSFDINPNRKVLQTSFIFTFLNDSQQPIFFLLLEGKNTAAKFHGQFPFHYWQEEKKKENNQAPRKWCPYKIDENVNMTLLHLSSESPRCTCISVARSVQKKLVKLNWYYNTHNQFN